MDRFLPWIAVAAGVLSLVVASSKNSPGGSRPASPLFICVIALGLAYALAFGLRSSLTGLVEVSHGIALGAALVLLAYFAEPKTGRSGVLAVGLATLVTGVTQLAPPEMRQSVLLGSVIGAGLAAACTAVSAKTAGNERLAAFAVATFAGGAVLGSYREGVDRAALVISVVGVISVLALAAASVGSLPKWAKWLLVAAILIGAAKLVAVRYLFLGASFNVALGAVASAAVVAWIMENEDGRSHGSFALCTLIWLAWSTVAFGLLQGLGVALSAVYAATFLIAVGSYRGLLSMSSLVALIFYRVFLEMYPAETRQTDVGQQYAVMGIVAGVVLPVAAASWLSRAGSRFEGIAKPSLALLAGLIAVALLVAADFILGSKGTVGVLIGLALAPFVAGLAGGERLGVLAAIGGLSATVVVTFRFVSPHLLMERADKLQILGWSIAAAIVLIAITHWLSKEKTLNESAA